MKKILTIVGARPQFIKAAAVSRAIAKRRSLVEIIVHTGQHYDVDMSDVFFEQMDIPKPQYHLGVGGGTHASMTGRQMEKIEQVLFTEKPDIVVVYGDTNSTLAGTLAAAKCNIPIAHIEAGLRSFNRHMPEEVNRVLTDHASTLLFAPTDVARRHLLREGIHENSVHVVGDVMYDASIYYGIRAKEPKWFKELALHGNEFVLCTVHRAENTDNELHLSSIFEGLGSIDLPVILPLHPRTKRKLEEFKIVLAKNIHLAPPVGYLEMVWLETKAQAIATDSGGVQKEAYFHNKFCVTLREETEWTELLSQGGHVLAGANHTLIASYLNSFMRGVPKGAKGLYGDGNSADKICDVLAAF